MALRQSLTAILLALTISACGVFKKDPRGKPPVVEVPVPVMPEPHEDLKACGEKEPRFQFRAHPEDEDSVVLYPEDQWHLRRWVEEKNRCRDAWRAWSEK